MNIREYIKHYRSIYYYFNTLKKEYKDTDLSELTFFKGLQYHNYYALSEVVEYVYLEETSTERLK